MITEIFSRENASFNLSLPARDRLLFHVELRIKEIMDKKGLTISNVSKMSGLRYETVQKYYYNQVRFLDIEILPIFCTVLECDISKLVVLIYNDKIKKSQKVKFEKSLEKV